MIKTYIYGGYMYYTEENGTVTAAVALTPFQNEDYHSIEWAINYDDNEVYVVHILCVNPLMQKQGLAKKIMDEVI